MELDFYLSKLTLWIKRKKNNSNRERLPIASSLKLALSNRTNEKTTLVI